jgi:S-adenosylmethionine/arginine decarboxylase-like enzyme
MVVPMHKHLIVRAECNNAPSTEAEVETFLEDVVNALDMNILSGPHVSYVDTEGNRGATGVVIIETSHCAIHVWDEANPSLVQLDVYTCGELAPKVIFDMIKDRFDPVKIEHKYLDREHGLSEVTAGLEDSTNPMVTGLDPNAVVG